jgi:hypothetical protein
MLAVNTFCPAHRSSTASIQSSFGCNFLARTAFWLYFHCCLSFYCQPRTSCHKQILPSTALISSRAIAIPCLVFSPISHSLDHPPPFFLFPLPMACFILLPPLICPLIPALAPSCSQSHLPQPLLLFPLLSHNHLVSFFPVPTQHYLLHLKWQAHFSTSFVPSPATTISPPIQENITSLYKPRCAPSSTCPAHQQ